MSDGKVGRAITDWVYVDVDGTLLLWPDEPGHPTKEQTENLKKWWNGKPYNEKLLPKVNKRLVEELEKWQKRRNGTIVIWTMGGEEHAQIALHMTKLISGAVRCMAKPDLMIDDGQRHLMAKHPVVLPSDFKCPDD